MTEIKIEIVKAGKKPGGRPVSEGWSLYDFEKVEGDKGKSLAKCGKCLAILKNTSIARMANHRKKCGSRGGIQKLIQSKIEHDEEEIVHEMEEPASSTILWTSAGEENQERYLDESIQTVQAEKVNQTAMEIVNEDIKRHRRSTKPKFDSNSIDAALSSFLIGCNLTFDVVDSSHFKKFVGALNHNYNAPSSSQLKARVLSQLKSMESPEKHRSKKRRYYDSSESNSD